MCPNLHTKLLCPISDTITLPPAFILQTKRCQYKKSPFAAQNYSLSCSPKCILFAQIYLVTSNISCFPKLIMFAQIYLICPNISCAPKYISFAQSYLVRQNMHTNVFCSPKYILSAKICTGCPKKNGA